MAVGWLAVVGGFGGASLAFLWPSLRGGFGAQIDVDTEEAILGHIRENSEPYPYPAGRMYLVEYDASLDSDGAYADLTERASLMALYQVCPHLGCKVPWCLTSQWFECPCHGSRYNRWGEWQGGPAPRGMDRFTLTIEDGRVVVDTTTIVEGPSRQAAVLDQPPEGPSCLGT
jgi:cytochrome b6-f complex iron-sulfur subunit